MEHMEPEQTQIVVPQQARTYGMLCHLLAFAGFFVPFGNIIGPLVMWLVKKDEMPFVDDQGKEVLNFQISMTIYTFVALLLCLILIGIPLLLALLIADLVLTIIGAIRANSGEWYRYPFTIRFIK
jgi:uncharacterized Tic20 family protein